MSQRLNFLADGKISPSSLGMDMHTIRLEQGIRKITGNKFFILKGRLKTRHLTSRLSKLWGLTSRDC